jgi:hypothetical protein
VLALAELPHEWVFPGGGGEWLYHTDELGFPVDWCARVRAVPNAEAQSKVRRKHRDLQGQVDEYDGEATGAPPQLADAIHAISDERSEPAARSPIGGRTERAAGGWRTHPYPAICA